MNGEKFTISVYRDAVLPDVDARLETIRVATDESLTWDIIGSEAHLQASSGELSDIPTWASALLEELGITEIVGR
jgi:hypothetical protein